MKSDADLRERLDWAWRFSIVYALMGILFVLNVTAISYPFAGVLQAPFLIMAIYYWSVFRPTLLPFWLVFIVGILVDLLSALPVGMTAFLFIIVRWLVVDQRRFLMGQPFIMMWSGFVVVLLIVALLEWLLFGLVLKDMQSAEPAVVFVALGSALFPVVSIILHLSHKLLPGKNSNFVS